jgi:hypothetical protein
MAPFRLNGARAAHVPGTFAHERQFCFEEMSMTGPRRPDSHKGAKTGVKPGETPNTTGPKGGKRPTEEEDVFGGAERSQKGGPVDSSHAKP